MSSTKKETAKEKHDSTKQNPIAANFSHQTEYRRDNFIARFYKTGSVRLEPGTHVIKAGHVTDLISFGQLKEKMSDEAVRNAKESIKYASEVLLHAKETGFKQGIAKFASLLVNQEKMYFETKTKLESLIHAVVISAVKKIINEEIQSKPDIVKNVVEKALSLVSDKKKVVIFVNSEDEQTLSRDKKRLGNFLEKAQSLKIQSSEEVKRGGCVIQTEDGVLNANIDAMVDSLDRAIRNSTKFNEMQTEDSNTEHVANQA